jgi:hypothetical protein
MGGDIMGFEYYYKNEEENDLGSFSFFRIPRRLIKDERYRKMSNDAKILYSLLLDRTALSIKKGWVDEENRVYIIYTMENMMEDVGCSKPTCVKILKELDSIHGIGLIEKKRRGCGKPDIIYVKNIESISSEIYEEKYDDVDIIEETKEIIENTAVISEVKDFNHKKLNNLTFRSKEILPQEVKNFAPNYTNINYTNYSYTNPNPIYPSMGIQKNGETFKIDPMDKVRIYQKVIKTNIGYDDYMAWTDETDKRLFDELYDIICDVVCAERETVRIAGVNLPHEMVKSVFLKLNQWHLEYVISSMKTTRTQIKNIKAYLVTSLYNAALTMHHFDQQKVQYDMWGGG